MLNKLALALWLNLSIQKVLLSGLFILSACIPNQPTGIKFNLQPEVTFSSSSSTITEGNGGGTLNVTLTATLSTSYLSSISVPVYIDNGSTASGLGTDHNCSSFQLVFPSGSSQATYTCSIVSDNFFEADETIIFNMQVSASSSASVIKAGAITTHTVTIVNDDSGATVDFPAPFAVTEGTGAGTTTATVTATLDAASGIITTVPFTINGASTATGADFVCSTTTITIPAGQLSATVDCDITKDSTDEIDEVITLTMGTPSGATAGVSTLNITITDDDAPPTVSFAPTASATEGTGAGTTNLNLVATLSALSGKSVTVPFTINAASTATAGGVDHDCVAASIVITAGSLTGTHTCNITKDALAEANETVRFLMTTGSLTNATAGATTENIFTIVDDDGPPVVDFAADASVNEGSGAGTTTITFTASLTAISGLNTVVPYTISGTATAAGTDHDCANGTITITAGSLTSTQTCSATRDLFDESDETIIATMTTGSVTGATVGGKTTQVITITDDDATPTVTFAATGSVTEGTGAGTTTITLTATLSALSNLAVSVPFTIGAGTATAGGTDHNCAANTITIAAQSLTGDYTCTVTRDAVNEANETVLFNMTTASLVNATAGATTTHTLTITDDDTGPTVTFAATGTIAEGTGAGTTTATLTATLSATSGQDVTVPFTINGSSTAAAAGVDHAAVNGSITIVAGQLTGDYDFTIVRDTLDEANETIIFNMTTGSITNATAGATTTHTLTITDDDSAPTVTFAATATYTEGSGAGTTTLTLTATLSGVSGLAVDVPFTLGAGTATAGGTDHNCAASTITIPVGQTTADYTCLITRDTTDEVDETIIFNMTTGSLINATAGATTSHTATITDDDNAPTVTFAATASIAEGTGAGTTTGTLTATLSAVSGVAVTVPFTLGAGTATAAGTDHDAAAASITINAGSTTGDYTFTVTRDAVDESDETVIFNMTTGSLVNATAGATTTNTYTITDDDGPVTVNFAVAANAAEGSGAGTTTVTVTATLSGASGQAVTVPFTIGAGTSTAVTDHNCAASSIVVSIGDTTNSYTCEVTRDTILEANETIIFNMTTGSLVNAIAGAQTTFTYTINNDDAAPTVDFNTNVSYTEGTGAGTTTLTLTATLSAASELAATVPFTIDAGSTAVAGGTDHNCAASAISITAGQTSADYTCTITRDTTDEPNESIIFNMTTGSLVNALAGTTTTHTATINDDDNAPTVTFTATSTIAEGTGAGTTTGTLTATLSEVSGYDVTVPFTLGAGTATAGGTDHNGAASSIVITKGNTSADYTFTITRDALNEANETVILIMTTGSLVNATAGAITTHTLTISDDDGTVTVDFAATSSITEGTGAGNTITLTATLNTVSGLDVTVPFTINGSSTATATTDHNCVASSISITAGNTTGSYTCTTVGDALDEANETIIFNMTTGSLVNATGGSQIVHTATITDDDATPTVTFAATSSVTEGTGAGNTITITATLSAVSGLAVQVPFTVGGTATATTDHNCVAATITISAGNADQSYTCTSVGDALDESDETVVATMTTGSLVNATAGATTVHTATITDDDNPPTVTFAATSSVAEGTGAGTTDITLTATLSGASGLAVTVPFTIGAGTATAGGTDHSCAASSIVIAAGSTTTDYTCAVTRDALDENNETVIFTMTTGSLVNATAGATTTHTATITDDDSAPTVTFAASSSVTEGTGAGNTITLTATLSAVSSLAVDVPFTIGAGTSIAVTDHNCAAATITIAAGQTTTDYTCTSVGDTLDEANETVIFTMTTASLVNATAGATTTHTATINDDDNPPTVTFAATSSATEGTGVGTTDLTLTATLSAVSGLAVSVPFTLGAGTSTAGGTDHNCLAGTINIAAGATTGDYLCDGVQDAIDESNETVIFNMTTGSLVNATAGATTTHTLTITDDDNPPTVTFAATSSVTEGTGAGTTEITLTATLSAASGLAVTVPFTLGAGTATAGATDHSCAASSIVIAAGSTTNNYTCAVTRDALDENDETVIFDMTTGSLINATAGATTTHTATITDDDSPPTVAFAATGSVTEGTGGGTTTITLTATLSAASSLAVTVPFTINGSSTASAGGVDHDCAASNITITAGNTTGNITCTATRDSMDESNETIIFDMTTGSLVNATAGAITTHTLTITDDDAAPSVDFALASSATNEGNAGNTAIQIQIDISAASGLNVTVPYTITGTATGSGTDHDCANGSAIITAGNTSVTIDCNIIGETLLEADETIIFTMTTGSITNGAAGSVTVHTKTITNDDAGPTVQLGANFAANEGNAGTTTVDFTATLSAVSGLATTVPLQINGSSTATSNVDYDQCDTQIIIPAGQLSATGDCRILGDTTYEANETIIMEINTGSLVNATAGADTDQVFTITNDDAAPTVAFSVASQNETEGNAGNNSVTVTINLSLAIGLDVTIPYTLSGTATGGGSDHDCANGSASITAGNTTVNITCDIISDTTYELGETIIFTIGTPTNATASGTTVHTVTIVNDDTYLCAGTETAFDAVGTGTVGDPYVICTADQFDDIGENVASWNKYFILYDNIDMTSYNHTNYNIIGDPDVAITGFTGYINGNSKTISNLTYNNTGKDNAGVFGRVYGAASSIYNLNLTNIDITCGNTCGIFAAQLYSRVDNIVIDSTSSITGTNDIGSLAGQLNVSGANIGKVYTSSSAAPIIGASEVGAIGSSENTTIISTVTNTGTVTCSSTRCGGIAGLSYSIITTAINSAAITSTSGYVGGLIGSQTGGSITSSYSTGNVTGQTERIGGAIGMAESAASITTSYATGNVTSTGGNSAGGFIGHQLTATVTNSYAKGNVTSNSDYVGGFVGLVDSAGTISNSYAEGVVSYTGTSAVSVGGFVGLHAGSDNITRSYAMGHVTSTGSNAGGFVGILDAPGGGTITESYAFGNVYVALSTAGGFVGECAGGSISDSFATGQIYSDADTAGGFAGKISSNCGNVVRSFAIGNVHCDTDNCGGFVGLATNTNSTISSCYAYGNVYGTQDDTGGFVGEASSGAIIDDSFATGNVSSLTSANGPQNTGGFVGLCNSCLITRAFNRSPSVTGRDQVGGFAGLITNAGSLDAVYSVSSLISGTTDVKGMVGSNDTTHSIRNSFWDVQTSSIGTDDLTTGSNGGVGQNTADLKSKTFMQANGFSNAEWIWGTNDTDGASYPYLKAIHKCFGTEYTQADPTDTGSGTLASPHYVCTAAQLAELSQSANATTWNRVFIMQGDISFSGTTFASIGTSTDPFTGLFIGNGRSNIYRYLALTLNKVGSDNVGLFGYNSGTLVDITLSTVNIDGKSYVGGIVARNLENGKIFYGRTGGNIDSAGVGASYIGGIVGLNQGLISKSESNATIVGVDAVGGIAGLMTTASSTANAALLEESYFYGGLTASGDFTGGIVGYQSTSNSTWNKNRILNCVAIGTLSGTDFVGGVVGDSDCSLVEKNYAAQTSFVGTDTVTKGGVSGDVNAGTCNATLSYNYWDFQAMAVTFGAGTDSTNSVTHNWVGLRASTGLTILQNSYKQWDFSGETVKGTKMIWTNSNDTTIPNHRWRK